MIGLQEAARARNEGYDIVMGQVDNLVIAPAIQKHRHDRSRRRT